MKWTKLGLIYTPKAIHPKLISHAANPLPLHLDGDVYRVFFNGRAISNRSSVGYVDIDIQSRTIVNHCEKPAFEFGPKDSYYEYGVSIGSCYTVGSQTYMLFMGWQHPPTGHWRGDIGRLTLDPDLGLHLESNKPFLESNDVDPISISYPFAMWTGENYEMWYGSTITWDAGNGEMIHAISHAISADGHHWQRNGLAVPFEVGVAQAFSRPTVVKDNNGSYEMWFSYRGGLGTTYRIGYAKKEPGKGWRLHLNETGIDVSESGWDSEMIEYPYVFDHKGSRYMLYCGNSYGKTGFGLAISEN